MIIQCPECASDNVTNLSADSNDFICNDCGEDFQAENGLDLEDDEEELNDNKAHFDNFDLDFAKGLAEKFRKKDDE